MSTFNPMDLKSALDEDRQFRETHSKSRGRRVKIEKPGHAWLVRFLPVQMGKKGLFFVRQGQHWLHKSPIFCPRWVATDFGGDPEAECPVCALSEELNQMDNEELSNAGFEIRANVTYLTWCVVFEIDRGRGDSEKLPMSEILKPWEFQHYQGSFDELSDYFKRGQSAKRGWSVLDLEAGNDFWATKVKGKGIRFDRSDPAPIFPLDEHFDKNVDLIFSQISKPRIEIPTLKQLETFARKAEAWAYGNDDGGGRDDDRQSRGRGRGAADEEEPSGEDEGRPSRRFGRGSADSAPAGRRVGRGAPAPQEEEQQPGGEEQPGDEQPQDSDAPPAEEDQVPGAEVPPRRTAVAPPPRTAAPARTGATPPPRTGSAPSARAGAAGPSRTGTTPPPRTGSAPPPPRTTAAAKPAATGVARPAQAGTARPGTAPASNGVRKAPAPAAAAPPRRTNNEQSSVTEEEDPGVAEEQQDQADAAEQPLAEDAPQGEEGQEGQEAQEGQGEEGQGEEAQGGDQEEAPPARGAATAQGGMRSRLANRLSGAPKR